MNPQSWLLSIPHSFSLCLPCCSPFAAAFIDIDEFFVFTDGTDDLPALLRGFEEYGGVGVNWRFFGSSERGAQALP